jgi:hypothetical protein
VVREAKDPARTDQAAVLLSTCLMQGGDLAGAGLAVERLLESTDPAQRAEAELRAGVAYRRLGRTAEAIDLLGRSVHPGAPRELVAALADAGRVDDAVALSDSLIAAQDSLVPWGAVLEGIARHAPGRVGPFLDHLLARGNVSRDSAAAWLQQDGERVLPADTAQALRRFAAAYANSPTRPAGMDAHLRALGLRLAVADDDVLIDSLPGLLEDVPPSTGNAYLKARQLASNAARIGVLFDSVAVLAPQGDLRAFILGELLRDSLGADRLAARLWRGIVDSLPESPYAAKAFLALGSLGEGQATVDSLATRFPASPYLIALQGGDDAAFRLLEDSLARFARAYRTPPRPPARPGRRPAAAAPSSTDLP